jgi:hypothetical protein
MFALLVVASARAQDVKYNFMPGTDFTKYHTCKWVNIEGASHPNQIVDAEIKQSVGRLLGRHCCPGRFLRPDRTAGVCGCATLEETGEMAVADFHSTGASAGLDRLAACGLFTMATGAIFGVETAAVQYKVNPALLVAVGAIVGVSEA